VGPARSSFRLDAIVSVAAYETPASGEKHLRASEAGAAHTSERNPRSRHTRELLHRVACELAAAGWKLREVTTDNGSEFRAREFRDAVERLDARQRFIRAGRPNSNGCVERVQLTILEECWRPDFARSLDRPGSGPRRVPDRLQLRPRPHRAPHPRSRARRHRLRSTQNQPRKMTTCAHQPGVRTS
jgi:transposase InsO family protein